MTQLKPPWIRADLSGIAASTHTEHALVDLLEGFTQEAMDCNVKPHQLITAFQHIQYELEHKRLAGGCIVPKKKGSEKIVEHVASVTPFPMALAAAK